MTPALPHVDYGIGHRQIRYEWPPIAPEQAAALEAALRKIDYDYPHGSVRVDGFRIPTLAFGAEDYWRKPALSRVALLAVFAAHGVTHVKGYDLPLGHRSPDGHIGHDDSADAVVLPEDVFEIDLPYTGEDTAVGRGHDVVGDKERVLAILAPLALEGEDAAQTLSRALKGPT